MKTEKEFEALAPAFYEAVKGKTGSDYHDAIMTFSQKNSFESFVICILYVSEVEEVIFLTDHPFNDIGFIIGEEFGGRWGFYVGSKKEFKAEFKKFRSLIGQNKKLSLN